MAAPGGPVRGRADRAAETLVAAVLRKLAKVGIASEVRKVPEVRAILESPDEVRRQCILLLAGPDGYLLAPGQHYADQVVRVLSVIARRRVGLTCADLEALLALPPAELQPEQTLWITDKIRVLGRQIEHAYPGLNRDEQARVKPLLERAASEIRSPPAAVRIRKLTGTGQQIRYELIGDADDAGQRLRAVIEASPEPDEARAAVLNLLAAFPATGRPGKAWHAEAERVRGLLARPAGLAAGLLDAALGASDFEEEFSLFHFYSGTRVMTRYVTAGNESFLCGTAKFAGVVADPALLPRLRRLAVKSAAVIGRRYYRHARSRRLANASAEAIADAGLPASVTELLVLEGSIRSGALLKQIRKAIDALAAQGLTRPVTRDAGG